MLAYTKLYLPVNCIVGEVGALEDEFEDPNDYDCQAKYQDEENNDPK